MPSALNLTGQRFGRLLVIKEDEPIYTGKFKERTWLCQCDCGNTKVVRQGCLRSGITTSCGCFRSELHRKHGESNVDQTKEYRAYRHMKERCTNPNNQRYHRYGGRGIKVCQRWLESYANFLEDMGRAPSPKHSIDRIDNNGDYEPSNCKWATTKEQTNNQEKNVLVTFNGETLTITQWSERIGIGLTALKKRLRKWPLEKALTTPSKHGEINSGCFGYRNKTLNQ